MNGEIVSSHVKATENTTLAKLTPIDQFKLLLRKLSNDDVAELDAAEKLSAATLKNKAALTKLLTTAAQALEDGEHQSVTMAVSSKFLPYLDETINSHNGLGRFYDFEVEKKDLPVNVEYKFIVKIRRRVT